MFRNKKLNLILSILLAIGLWVYVVSELNPTGTQTFRDVPVQLLNTDTLANNGLVISGQRDFNVDVVIEGSRANLVSFSKEDISLTANVGACTVGDNYIFLVVTVPSTVSVSSMGTQSILVQVEEYEEMDKSIRVEYTGSLPEDSEIEIVSMVPETVKVSGPSSYVHGVNKVVASVDYSELGDADTVLNVPIAALDASGLPAEKVDVSAKGASVTFRKYYTKTVPVFMMTEGEVADGYVLAAPPAVEVKIRGTAEAIENINNLSAAPVSVEGLSESTTVELVLDLPEGVSLASGESAPVMVLDIAPVSEEEGEKEEE